MLLLLVRGMMVVLEELVVFVGGLFDMVKPQNFFLEKTIESKKKFFSVNKNLKILKMMSKIHLYFRVRHSIVPL